MNERNVYAVAILIGTLVQVIFVLADEFSCLSSIISVVVAAGAARWMEDKMARYWYPKDKVPSTNPQTVEDDSRAFDD